MGDDREDPPTGPPDQPEHTDPEATRPISPSDGPPGPSSTPDTPGESRTGGASGPAHSDATERPPGWPVRIPPAEGGQPQPWSGRAEVPPASGSDYADQEWYEEEPQGRWWTPILLGLLVLLLLGMLAVGIWLIVAAERRSGPSAPVTPSVVPSTPPSSTETTEPPTTTAPPATTPPETTVPPTSAAPSRGVPVPMPPLVGLSQSQAESVLKGLDIAYRVQNFESNRPAGTVLATDPRAGALVRPGSTVTLVVAVPRSTPTGATTRTPTPRPTR